MKRLGLARLSAALLLAGAALPVAAQLPAAPAAAPPAQLPPIPAWGGTLEPQDRDERGLWMMSADDEQLIRGSRFVIDDPALNAYVRGVLCKAVGADRCQSVRLYVMRVPVFNASMHPNGMMQIWSGALLRMRGEAELAAVLGHEFAHYERRHSLAGFKQARAATDAALWAAFIPIAGLAVSLGALQGFFIYNQAQEKEADLGGLSFVQRAGYSTAAFADVWERLIAEEDAGRVARGQKPRAGRRSGFFATHPPSAERMTYLRALARQAADTGDPGAASLRAGLGAWFGRFLEDQVKLNDFGGTEWLLADLARRDGWTGQLLSTRGDLYRLRGQDGDMAIAAGLYREALAKGHADPETRRGLGLALLRQGQQAEGQAMLKAYLEAKPDAGDAAMLRMMAGLPSPATAGPTQ